MTDQTPTRQHTAGNTTLKKPRSTADALARRRFKPQFIQGLRAQLREAFGLSADDTLPDVFRVPVAVPLKIGIKQDLQNRYGIRDPKHPRCKLIARALKRYCQSTQYQYAILRRFDTNLKPAQPITDEDRRTARIKLEWHRKTREKARTGSPGQPEPPARSS